MTSDQEALLKACAWQFEEAVSLLREARPHVPDGILAHVIDGALVPIDAALIGLKHLSEGE